MGITISISRVHCETKWVMKTSTHLTHNKHLSNVNYYLNLPYDIYHMLSSVFDILKQGVNPLLDEVHIKGRDYILFRAPVFHWVNMASVT